MIGVNPPERAYLAPFIVFLAFLLLGEIVKSLGDGYAYWALAQPRYWIFPLQTGVCALLLVRHWRHYDSLRPTRGLSFATLAGGLALGLWIAPQWLAGAAPRIDGFEPHYFGDGAPHAINLTARLIRMIIIVPLVEEIFWRGFLMRYLIREDFKSVPVGAFTWKSFLIVSVAFCFEHTPPDWPAAFVTSILYNCVAIRTRSLLSCVVAHAVTNAGLACYILATRQWGFW
jgi:uncharacterized protein